MPRLRLVLPLAALLALPAHRAPAQGTAPNSATAQPPTKPATPADSAGKRTAAAKKPARPTPVWPVKGPAPLPGAILPAKRIVAYYGNPLSKRMGILGELPPERMLERLDREVARWEKADPSTPVQPALHLIAVVAQGSPGRDGKYRLRMSDSLIERVAAWAASRDAILFLDVQLGLSTLREELPRLVPFLQRPNVHLAIDPEFSMKRGHKPGTRIGTLDAADVNYASDLLARLVTEHRLPPKVLVVHRFTRPMLTNARKIALDPRVQIVVNMDGWGAPWLKRASYRQYVYSEPVQFTGFKLFYHNDTKKGHPLMTPAQVLELHPKPLYIQYQ
ncbi:MAG TPA: hypothetical protein VFS08_16120 [Gemmatimonadaceae bacterium]|nr:hypothetical protein [Gemmatimonadaceae bacterium]